MSKTNLLDSIRYGENLSLLFKCLYKKPPDDKLEMKHISLSNDPTIAMKYVRKILEILIPMIISSSRLMLVTIQSVISFVILSLKLIQSNLLIVKNLPIIRQCLHCLSFFSGK